MCPTELGKAQRGPREFQCGCINKALRVPTEAKWKTGQIMEKQMQLDDKGNKEGIWGANC